MSRTKKIVLCGIAFAIFVLAYNVYAAEDKHRQQSSVETRCIVGPVSKTDLVCTD